ncbi:hypothetical protein THOM_2696, partial [Trachipleistophora hominis]
VKFRIARYYAQSKRFFWNVHKQQMGV